MVLGVYGNGAGLSLILHHAAESDAGGIIDADMDELPADATSIAPAGAVSRDAMTGANESAELFDIDVDQFAGMLAFIAAD